MADPQYQYDLFDLGFNRDLVKEDDFYSVLPKLVSKVTDPVNPATIASGEVSANVRLVGEDTWQSNNFVSGSAGWRLGPTSAEFIDVIVSGVLTAGEIHIPDQDTTANSMHVSTVGHTWWGATETNFNADPDNAAAYILSTGVFKLATGYFSAFTVDADKLAVGTDIIIDGTNKAISINDSTYGNDGIQIQYNGGTSRLYAGDGLNEYVKWDGTNFSFKGAYAQLGTDGKLVITGGQFANFYVGTNDFWGGNAAIDNAATTIVVGNLDGTSKVALGASADAITVAGTEEGVIADGSGNFRAGNATDYVKFTTTGGFSFAGTNTSLSEAGKLSVSDLLADGGQIGSWYIHSQTLSSGATEASSNVLIDSANSLMRLGPTSGNYVTVDGANVRIQSSNYVSGPLGAGFSIDPAYAEFGNVLVRGKVTTTAYVKGTMSVFAGNPVITNGDVLALDMTAADSSTLTISGDTTFAVNDMLVIADGVDIEYLRVTNIGSAPTYTVTRDLDSQYAADTNPAWKAGTSVQVFGSSDGISTYSGGWLYMTGAGTNGPYYAVVKRTGVAATAFTEYARFGNLKGFLDYASDEYGIAIGDSDTFMSYDTTDGLRATGLFSGGSSETKVVAASDSLDAFRGQYRCDGTADEVEINQAITAVYNAGGGKVKLMNGTYTINDSVVMKDNVRLEGCGDGTIIYAQNNASIGNNDRCVQIKTYSGAGPTNVQIANLKIDANKATQTNSFGAVGFFNHSGAGTLTTGCVVESVTIVNSEQSAIYTIAQGGLTTTGGTIEVRSCTIADGNSSGIFINNGEGSIITGCTIHDNGSSGISLLGCPQTIISSNVCYENAYHGIYIYTCSDTNIVGNTCYGNLLGGIELRDDSSNCQVTSNLCYGNANGETDRANITILAASTKECSHNFVSGNLVRKDYGAYVSTNGISVYGSGTLTENVIVNNDLYDAGDTNAIHDVTGTNTRIRNNMGLSGDWIDESGTWIFDTNVVISDASGLDINPGSDTDADLITVGVPGSPKMWWDESDDAFNFSKGVHVDSTVGFDVNPGSDTDADLITVAVTGSPKLWWDESEDAFAFSKGIFVPVPCFKVYIDTQEISNGSATTIQFNQEVYDDDGLFDNSSTYAFTAPYDGIYHLDAQVMMASNDTIANKSLRIYFVKNGSTTIAHLWTQTAFANTSCGVAMSRDVQLSAGDTVVVKVYHDYGITVTVAGGIAGSNFSGHLVKRL